MDFYILIPYYNNFYGLLQSLKSICYDAEKYGILIIDDGSETPLEESRLNVCFTLWPYIKIIRLPHNEGIVKALNTGLKWLRQQHDHKYIARLDCGDICAPNRFYRQVVFLDHHPETDLLGSWCIFRDDEKAESYVYKTATRQEEIEKEMHFRNVFIHPAVMWRADAMRACVYPQGYPHAEDYGLFYNMIHEKRCAILPEKLMVCTINRSGLSMINRREQLESRIKVVRAYGKNRVLAFFGILKLRMMMLIPYSLIFYTKKLLHPLPHY